MTRGMRIRRRRQQIKLMMTLAVVVFALAILSAFVFKGQSVKGAEIDFEKTYEEVVVYYGDTVWSIAQEHYDDDFYDLDEYVDEILSVNSMEHTNLTAGHVILIPVVLQ